MVNIQMDLTGMERGAVCSCENGHGTSGSMTGERFLDKQSDSQFLLQYVISPSTISLKLLHVN